MKSRSNHFGMNLIRRTFNRRARLYKPALVVLLLSSFWAHSIPARASTVNNADFVDRKMQQCKESQMDKGCEKYFANLAKHFFSRTGDHRFLKLSNSEILQSLWQRFCRHAYANSTFSIVPNARFLTTFGRMIYLGSTKELLRVNVENGGKCTFTKEIPLGRFERYDSGEREYCFYDGSFSASNGDLETRYEFISCTYRDTGRNTGIRKPTTLSVIARHDRSLGNAPRLEFSFGKFVIGNYR
jgi:hypothetical protein